MPDPQPLPPPPIAPDPSDCCGGGCARCVNDVYDEALREWDALVAARRAQAAADLPSG
jgi:Oxidoreductase-like protein, N-terminal